KFSNPTFQAQRKWKKLYEKLESSKKAYYSACRQEKSALVNLTNSQADSSVSLDGAQKLRDRLEKCREDVQKCKSAYEKNIAEITQYSEAVFVVTPEGPTGFKPRHDLLIFTYVKAEV
ncbi:hypothetical protein ANCCAN_11129, partial [Ancylostoma caninum]